MDVTAHAPRARFAEPGIVRQGWYLLARSRKVRRGKLVAVPVGSSRVVVRRDLDGVARVTDDRCPHLGADLALARVTPDGLRCAFHGWCWGPDGACAAAPGNPALPARRLRAYATEERHGFVWAWLGSGAPAFPLPQAGGGRAPWVLMPRRVGGHADVVFSNGFDLAHFGPSHGIEAETVSLRAEPPWRVSHHLRARLPRRTRLSWAGLSGKTIDATFARHGGGIVHVEVREPLPFDILFTLRPVAGEPSRAQTLLFLPRRALAPRALALLWGIAVEDIPLMETMRWTAAYADADEALAGYAELVESMPLWAPGTAPSPSVRIEAYP